MGEEKQGQGIFGWLGTTVLNGLDDFYTEAMMQNSGGLSDFLPVGKKW